MDIQKNMSMFNDFTTSSKNHENFFGQIDLKMGVTNGVFCRKACHKNQIVLQCHTL